MSADEFFAIAERVSRMIRRRMYELAEELEKQYSEIERLFDERLRMVNEGFVEPLVSVVDRGDHYLIIVEAPGVKGRLDIKLGERSISIDGYLDESFAREAFGDVVWARRIRRVHGTYVLPEDVDIEGVRLERRGNTIIIIAPKRKG